MTDKQIIIDGVNVLNCGHYSQFEGETENACYIMQKTFIGKEEISKEYCSCETNPNCYYKQLKRKKQECEELKEVNRHIEYNRTQKADKLMRIEKLITACSTGYTDEFIQELLIILLEPEPIKE